MANTLTAVTPKLLAQGLLALRQNAIMPQIVNRRFEAMAGQRGSTIDVPIPSAIAAQAVAPGNTPPSTADISPTSVPIPLDQWFEGPFYLDDKDMLEAQEGTIPMQASEAIKSLANNVDTFLLNLGRKFFGYAGNENSSLFADEKTTDATAVRTILNKQLAPLQDRRVVLDPDAEGSALNVRAFQDASFSGDTRAIIEGNLNNKLGFTWWMDQNVPVFTAGTAVDYLVNDPGPALALGDTAIPVDGGTGDVNEGDIITFSGHTQTYVITVAAVAPSIMTIQPGLQAIPANNEVITLKGDHVLNQAFHRDATAFATRPLAMHGSELGVISQSAVDPISGLTLRLEITHEHKRIRFSYDILYGAEVIRRELGSRFAAAA